MSSLLPLKNVDPNRALIIYSGIMTVAVAWGLFSGAGTWPSSRFDVVDVHRINVRDADGTLRMVVASRDRFPGLYVHGKEQQHRDRSDVAGLIFINEEGTENGGLIFSGSNSKGNADSSGHLSFDQYDQDQVVTLEQTEEDGRRAAGLTIDDRPDAAMNFDVMKQLESLPKTERAARQKEMREHGDFGYHRLFLGKTEDRDALVALRDAKGHVRLRMRVTAAGTASIEFLDAAGNVVKTEGPG